MSKSRLEALSGGDFKRIGGNSLGSQLPPLNVTTNKARRTLGAPHKSEVWGPLLRAKSREGSNDAGENVPYTEP